MKNDLSKKIEELSLINDEWGGIDKKIVMLVAALNLSGVKTSISCAGHVDRSSQFPYVTFRGSRRTVGKFLSEFYKNRRVKKDTRINIYKGKDGFWLYSGAGFLVWKKKVQEKAKKISEGKKVESHNRTREEKLKIKVKLLCYQKEMNEFAKFLEYKING